MHRKFFKAGIRGNFSISKSFIKSCLLVGTFAITGCYGLNGEGESVVAVEPITCDLVNAIAAPDESITCLVERNVNVHNFKISPLDAQSLSNASQIITLGREMTPAIRKNRPPTLKA